MILSRRVLFSFLGVAPVVPFAAASAEPASGERAITVAHAKQVGEVRMEFLVSATGPDAAAHATDALMKLQDATQDQAAAAQIKAQRMFTGV